jgi:hypothetical protein
MSGGWPLRHLVLAPENAGIADRAYIARGISGSHALDLGPDLEDFVYREPPVSACRARSTRKSPRVQPVLDRVW